MKKLTVLLACFITLCFAVTAQTNATIPVTDDIYEFLDVAQKKGLCSPLNSYKPYTKSQIFNSLIEIYDNAEKMSDKEIKITEDYLALYEPLKEETKNSFLKASVKTNNEKFFASLNYKSEFEFVYSGGLYTN